MIRNKRANRNGELKRLYGITIEDYERLSEEQDHRCAICNSHSSDVVKGLHVDHCHTTHEVRGLLCQKCNQGLGLFKDNIEVITRAINFLKGKDNEKV